MAININPTPVASNNQAQASKPAKRNWNVEIRFGAPTISLDQRMVFTERLSLLLETGVSLLEALKAMQQQTEEVLLADIIGSLVDTISEGKSFSVALEQHPEMFSTTYTSLVFAAEQGGFLPQVLSQLLRMDEKNSQLRSNIVSALSYPAFLIAFSIAVVVFVLVVIFPKFEVLFASIHDQLPITTIFLMALSGFVRHYWILIIVGLVAAGWATMTWMKSPAGKLVFDQFKMNAPLIKDIYRQIYLSQTLSVLGLSLSNGVPITVALKASQGVVKNLVFVKFLDEVRNHVNEGRGIAIGFTNTPFVPPMVRQMVATGEQTGNLGLVMSRVADFYERELTKRITILSKSIEPIMLVLMGVVVGLIVISLILPIFKLSRAVH
ncbi:type II secretion system F family protein [Methylotenera sp.]|uniref:type II secretion system F family protein n=1 Tax=Methylotenera sp. TaxID=2051956 RepID=UPI00248A76B0|nr:type II secretion system F family protein [Methylotenera sp.]MDI1298381.1 type II secretion system F family protein [Methylotenera sp.]